MTTLRLPSVGIGSIYHDPVRTGSSLHNVAMRDLGSVSPGGVLAMNLSLYVPGATLLHRMSAGYKLTGLLVAGVSLFLTSDPLLLGLAALAAAGLIIAIRAPMNRLRPQLTGIALILAFVVVATGLLNGWSPALVVLFRVAALVLFALAVTITTRFSDLLDTVELGLSPMERLGMVNASQVSLAVSLVLRFLPEIFKHAQEVREAQAARGLEASPLALVVPLVVRTLKNADVIADAIDARGYSPTRGANR